MKDQAEQQMLRLIAGEIDPRSAAGQVALKEAGLTLEDLAELQSISTELDELGDDSRQIAVEGEALDDAPGLDDVEATFLRLAAESSPQTPEQRPGETPKNAWGWLWAVAAVLLILPLLLKDKEHPKELMLGNHGIQVEFDGPGTIGYGPIRFQSEVPTPGADLVMSVFDGNQATRVTPLFHYQLEQSPWFDSEEQAQWPAKVYVRVEAITPGQSGAPYGWVERSRD